MENVKIWYLTDNNHGLRVVEAVNGLGLTVKTVSNSDLADANIVEHDINIVIVDILNVEPEKLISRLSSDQRLHNLLKLMILKKKEIKKLTSSPLNIMHLELISRPVEIREFLLLLEKSIIVERYREILGFISSEAESRIETYEGLMDINRKGIFESEKEKQTFEKIITYEKNLIMEQSRLNRAIQEFSILRQNEVFDMRNRIRAEEMLSELRRKELMDAHNTIDAQESVINYSAQELYDAQRIINATEKVAELGRSEAMHLHSELKSMREENNSMREEIAALRAELEKKNRSGE